MPEKSRKSLSLRAAGYVLAICLAILGLEGWREWSAHDSAILRAELETHNLARSLRQHAEDTYEIAEQVVSAVAFELQDAAPGHQSLAHALHMMRAAVASTPRLSGISALGPDGRWLVTTAENLPPGPPQSDYQYFRNHKASISLAPFFGTPIRGGARGQWIIPVSKRINKPDGSFGGVVMASIDAEYFANFYADFDVGRQGSVSLVSSGGVLLSRYPYQPAWIGIDHGSNAFFNESLAEKSSGSVVQVSSIDKVERIAGFDSSTRYAIVAVVAVSKQEALAPWFSGALQRIALTVGLTLGIALLGFRLAEQIYRRQRSEAVLMQKEAEFRLLAESASDLVERFDGDGRRLYVSPALERLTGYVPAEVMEHSAFDMVHEDDLPEVQAAAERLRTRRSDQETVAYRIGHKQGHEIWLETSLRIASDANAEGGGVVGVTRDITARKQLEMKLEGMATVDGLTGIANRRAFDAAMEREVARARRNGTPLALLIIDADQFKRFNDDYGHLAGDACLKAMARVVGDFARRPTDLAARYGGEELALLLPDMDLRAADALAIELCRKVEALGIPHARNLPWKVATVSVGTAAIARFDTDPAHDANWLINTADMALYDAKARGRNQAMVRPTARDRLAG